MLLDPDPDQDFLRVTTERFLDDVASPDRLRGPRRDDVGFDEAYWTQGAELGWTSFLVAEAHGGGSLSGAGLVDLTFIAHEFGRFAAPGPLLDANVVAAALSDTAAETHGGVLDQLLTGASVASWCVAEPAPHDPLGDATLQVAVSSVRLAALPGAGALSTAYPQPPGDLGPRTAVAVSVTADLDQLGHQ
jgi:alkylation response protein AidB-like acyl-CoA dehydrogenase